VLNRFDDECGAYHDFVEGLDIELSFITLAEGLGVVDPDRSREVIVVPDLSVETVLPVAEGLIDRHGPLDGLTGLSEKVVVASARLREKLGLPGWSVELATRFKDKLVMKRAVAAAGLRTPRFLGLAECAAEVSGGGAVDLADPLAVEFGWPVVLKPLAEGASRGVSVHRDLADLADRLERIDLTAYEAEEFVSGQIVHVDGVLRDGEMFFVSASFYVGTCLGHAHGDPLGSVLFDHGPVRDRVIRFAVDALAALGLRHGPFHLEAILTSAVDDGLDVAADVTEPVFLEVGLRPGGADVPFVLADTCGIDLFAEAFRCSLGLPTQADPAQLRPAHGAGWLNVPEPFPRPCRVIARNPIVGVVPGVYAELLPDVGHVFRGAGGYDYVGGRFRVRGVHQAEVERGVRAAAATYDLVVEAAS
jgi:biotin carboxylase